MSDNTALRRKVEAPDMPVAKRKSSYRSRMQRLNKLVAIVSLKNRQLAYACRRGNADDVRQYIRERADVNQCLDLWPDLGWAPIHLACRLQGSAILAILLENGADPNLLAGDGSRALDIACCNDAEGSKKMVQMLLAHGADADAFDGNGMMAPLHHACKSRNAAVVEVLLEHGANVNLPTRDGAHPLHIAVSKGEENIIVMLLKHGADINALDSNGMAPLHHACNLQNAAIVAALLGRGANVNLLTRDDVHPLHISFSKGKAEITQMLLKHGADVDFDAFDSNGRTPLHHACDSQNAVIVALLLERYGVNVNLPTRDGVHPLHIALSKGKEEIVRMLVAHGADVNAVQQMDGSTPLHIACLPSRYHGRANLIDLLLNQQANINVLDSSGFTPLHLALSSYDWRIDLNHLIRTIESFLKHGVDVNAG